MANRVPIYRIPPFCASFLSRTSALARSRVHTQRSSGHVCPQAQCPSASLSSASSSSFSSAQANCDGRRWRPICLYYTQGKCTKMDDALHLERFNHDCSRDLQMNAFDLERKRSQEMDFFLVLDLEGKVEILEFPVLIIDARTAEVVDFFHRFVRPSKMSKRAIDQYIEGKYGKIGVDRVWHDTALPFKEVLVQFEAWLVGHRLWGTESGGCLNKAAFITCGNWDLKTKVPDQCKLSNLNLPTYFMEWVNLKDVYLNFYGQEARGMMSMMKQRGILPLGNHHLGIDDTINITKVLQRMLGDGAVMQITARRRKSNLNAVDFLFKSRVK